MDLIGAVILGFIIGIAISYYTIKTIAIKNKENFLAKIANLTAKPINHNEMIIDAIGSGLDELMHLHGQKVKIEQQYYIMCWINDKSYALPRHCLVSADNAEIS